MSVSQYLSSEVIHVPFLMDSLLKRTAAHREAFSVCSLKMNQSYLISSLIVLLIQEERSTLAHLKILFSFLSSFRKLYFQIFFKVPRPFELAFLG